MLQSLFKVPSKSDILSLDSADEKLLFIQRVDVFLMLLFRGTPLPDQNSAIARQVQDIFATIKPEDKAISEEKEVEKKETSTLKEEEKKKEEKKGNPTFVIAKFDFDAEDAQEVPISLEIFLFHFSSSYRIVECEAERNFAIIE